jgi:hypothetical protein
MPGGVRSGRESHGGHTFGSNGVVLRLAWMEGATLFPIMWCPAAGTEKVTENRRTLLLLETRPGGNLIIWMQRRAGQWLAGPINQAEIKSDPPWGISPVSSLFFSLKPTNQVKASLAGSTLDSCYGRGIL